MYNNTDGSFKIFNWKVLAEYILLIIYIVFIFFSLLFFSAKPCGPFPVINSASVVNEDVCKKPVYKTECEYECASGFKLISNTNKITCGHDGFWSKEQPACESMLLKFMLIFSVLIKHLYPNENFI